MTKKSLWMLAVGALAFAACGEGGGSATQSTDEAETGGLTVTLHNLTAANVKFIALELSADGSANNRAVAKKIDLFPGGAPGTLEPGIDQNSNATTGSSGNVTQWTFKDTNVPVGGYSIIAKAYNLLRTDGTFDSGKPTFQSVVVPVTVVANQDATAHIFLQQDVIDEDPFKTPFITAITFDDDPRFGEDVEIVVLGTNGTGNLELSANGVGTFSPDKVVAYAPGPVVGDGSANLAPGATIYWIPKDEVPVEDNKPGYQTITMELEDEDSNKSSVTISVWVDYQRGNIDFKIEFNQAPTMKVTSVITNDDDESVVTMTATYKDDEFPSEDVSYEWDVSDCTGKNFTVDSNSLSGSVFGNDTASHTVELTLDVVANPPATLPVTCTVEIKATDVGLMAPTGLTPPHQDEGTFARESKSSRTQSIEITVGKVVPGGLGPQP